MSSREKKSWEWGRKQRESGRALRGSSVAQGDPLPVSGIAAGRKRYGGRGCRALRAGRGRMRAGRVRVVDYPELFRLYCHIYCVKSQDFFLCYSRKVAKTE